MRITRDNYEIWFIDFMEGNLSEAQHQMLLAFMKEHPDLKNELEGLNTITLSPSTDQYLHKDKLTKHFLDDDESFQQACVGLIEQKLTEKETAELVQYTQQRPERAQDLQLFNKTILPREEIIFAHKEELKKSGMIWLLQPAIRVAAAIILGFALITSALYFISSPNNLDRKMVMSHAGPGRIEQTSGMQENTGGEKELAQITSNFVKENKTPSEELSQPIVNNTQKTTIEDTKRTFSNTQKLAPIKPVLKGSVLVFVSPMLDKVEPAANSPQDPGLIASLFRANKRAEEVVVTADKFAKVQLAPSLLNLLGEVTSERVTYDTRTDGDIAQVNFNSKLLNFTVPIKSNQN